MTLSNAPKTPARSSLNTPANFPARLSPTSTGKTPAKSLADLPLHGKATVLAVRASGITGLQLLEIGLVPGTKVELIRRGLGGDPLQINVAGGMWTLHHALAQTVLVQS